MFLPSCACSLAHLSRDLYSNLGNLPAIGYQFFQGDPGLCWGSSAFLIVDLTFHGQWHILPVGRRPPCSGSFAFLRSCTGFAHRTGASVEVVLARCNHCSSKLCLLFSPLKPRSLQQIRLHKNHNCGTVAGCHGSKMVLNRDCAVQKSEAAKL